MPSVISTESNSFIVFQKTPPDEGFDYLVLDILESKKALSDSRQHCIGEKLPRGN